ncbi:hypothetical protein P3T73_15195 [Kiritimatiellota bacterium B12222]|nr:hypothetical protein P3T73_15195 [Kiritimatiellota bacterium B12222]
MKSRPLLLLPGIWMVVSLLMVMLIGGASQRFCQSVTVFLLLSSFLVAPFAIVCGFVGLRWGLRKRPVGCKSMASLLSHALFLCVAIYLCVVAVNFPRIGLH